MNQLIRLVRITRRHGLRSTVATIKEHLLYNFGGAYMRKYDPSKFELADANPDKIYYVSPDEIQYFQPSLFERFVDGFDRSECPNPVVSGHWDRLRVSLEDRVFYRSLERHFQEDVPWEETVFIQQCLDDVRADRSTWHRSSSEEDVFDRCAEVDNLYQSIKKEGFSTQETLGEEGAEITVNISRDGSLMQSVNGKHRITIAKILQLDEVPVQIFARHKNCLDHKLNVNYEDK